MLLGDLLGNMVNGRVLVHPSSCKRSPIGVHGLADELAVTLHTDSTGCLWAAMVISLSCGVWVGFQEKLDDLAAFLLRCPVERKPVKATGLRGALRVGSQVVAALAPSGGPGTYSCARAGWGRRK